MADDGKTPTFLRNVEEFQKQSARCWLTCSLILSLTNLDALDKLTKDAEALGPTTEPEIWRTRGHAIKQDREMIRALATLQRDLLVTAPDLADLVPLVNAEVDKHRATLQAAFRDVFRHPGVENISPLVTLVAFHNWVANIVPKLPKGQ